MKSLGIINMQVQIFHNPDCGTSRNTLALIRHTGIEPEIIEYLSNPPGVDELRSLIKKAGLSVRDAIRQKGTPYAELGLDSVAVDDEALLNAMIQHPILINRPFVVTPMGTRLCRPSELVLDILPPSPAQAFVKEDGEAVLDEQGQRVSHSSDGLPNISQEFFHKPQGLDFNAVARMSHRPRFLLLYGSVRDRSYSRMVTMEAARLLETMGGDVKIYDPRGLPQPDSETDSHPKVQELRDLTQWAEGMVWCSPERHGAMTGILKSQIDLIPLLIGAVRPTQGKTLAVMQVSGGAQSFNAVNQMRILGRWMRMITIPNQSSVAKVFLEFDESGRMKKSSYYDRIVDVMEELFKFTMLTRDVAAYLVDRYSERKENTEELSERVNQKSI
jgi:arsenic resistance protein ArsH